jgi:hypothetical protein
MTGHDALGYGLSLFFQKFLNLLKIHQLQCLCRTNVDTDGLLHVSTAVTFEGDLSLGPGVDHPIGTERCARPAPDAAVIADHDQIRLFIPDQCTREAGIQAGCLKTMATLEGKRRSTFSFDTNPSLRGWGLLSGFEQRFPFASPLCSTIEFARLTARTAV